MLHIDFGNETLKNKTKQNPVTRLRNDLRGITSHLALPAALTFRFRHVAFPLFACQLIPGVAQAGKY